MKCFFFFFFDEKNNWKALLDLLWAQTNILAERPPTCCRLHMLPHHLALIAPPSNINPSQKEKNWKQPWPCCVNSKTYAAGSFRFVRVRALFVCVHRWISASFTQHFLPSLPLSLLSHGRAFNSKGVTAEAKATQSTPSSLLNWFTYFHKNYCLGEWIFLDKVCQRKWSTTTL